MLHIVHCLVNKRLKVWSCYCCLIDAPQCFTFCRYLDLLSHLSEVKFCTWTLQAKGVHL